MDQTQLQQVETLCKALYQGTNSHQRNEAQQQLLTLQSSIDFIPQCQFILDHSNLPYAQIVASSSLESLVTQFWVNFTIPQKVNLHNYILAYLANHALTLEDFVLGHLTKLSARCTKLGWFDSIEFREIINEITKFLDIQSLEHNLIGIRLLNSLVDEMNTPIPGRTITMHRKTAVSFRDQILLNIFSLAINQLKVIHNQVKSTTSVGGGGGGAGGGGSGSSNSKMHKLLNTILALASQCLSFDFIGTNPEESNEDVGTLQVPSTWRGILQDTSNLQLFFDIYLTSEPPRSSNALEAIVQLSSIRRSLFTSEQERTNFLQTLITNLQVIMNTKQGLEHIENYHEFCRILGRLKASYQLSELVKLTNFIEFLELAGDFTIKSLMNWQYSMNSIHYLLALWGRLVAALPYLRADAMDSQKQATILKQINLTVVQSYIQTMLDSVEVVITSDGNVEDPLDDEGSLKEQMERLPVIARLQYDHIAQYLVNNFEQALTLYHQYMLVLYQQYLTATTSNNTSTSNTTSNTNTTTTTSNTTSSTATSAIITNPILASLPTDPSIFNTLNSLNANQMIQQIQILEGRMTWLTHMVAAIIDSNANPSSTDLRKNQSELIWDGRLSRCIFTMIAIEEFKLLPYLSSSDGGAGGGGGGGGGGGAGAGVSKVHEEIQHNEKLELAILNYFRSYKKMYLLDSMATATTSVSSMMTSGGIGGGGVNRVLVPGGSPAHPLLSLVLSDSNRNSNNNNNMEKDSSADIANIYEAMGIGDMITIMNIIVKKLCHNIKHYHHSDLVLQDTLDVFVDLITSYSSSKTLLNLEIVNYIIHHHNGNDFPFLGYDNNNKYRITFYSALSRLVFTSSEDLNNLFDLFIAPNVNILHQLMNTLSTTKSTDLQTSTLKVAIVGILRDLRGITMSAFNKRTYSLLFETLYPTFFPLFCQIAEIYYDDPIVMTALLKFMQEFVANKGQRIFFENSSANGILLFRETSSILCSYGSQVLSLPVRQSIYIEKYKGIRLLLNTLTNALSGNYVNFGVFSLYQDPALQNALDISLQICLQIPLNDILAYIKLSRAYFAFLEILFRNHLDVLSGLDSSIFIQLIKTCQEGLQSSELMVNTSCSSAIDHLATYIFLNQNREKPVITMIRQHLGSDGEVLNGLMAALFNSLLFGTHATHWAVTRPILSLLLAYEGCYSNYVNYLLSTQPAENHEKLKEEFNVLTVDIQRSLEVTNRDRFTQKLTVFRLNVRSFLTL
eukprot:gene10658-11818_t